MSTVTHELDDSLVLDTEVLPIKGRYVRGHKLSREYDNSVVVHDCIENGPKQNLVLPLILNDEQFAALKKYADSYQAGYTIVDDLGVVHPRPTIQTSKNQKEFMKKKFPLAIVTMINEPTICLYFSNDADYKASGSPTEKSLCRDFPGFFYRIR